MIESGIYFRVKRNGKWQALLFEELTHKERINVLKNKEKSFLISLSTLLADMINRMQPSSN